MKQKSNYLQVGKAVACGHCEPEKFAEGLKQAEEMIPNFKCDCVCHQEPKQEWEEIDKLFGDEASHHYLLPRELTFLKSFIASTRQQAVEEYKRELGGIVSKWSEKKQQHPSYYHVISKILELLQSPEEKV